MTPFVATKIGTQNVGLVIDSWVRYWVRLGRILVAFWPHICFMFVRAVAALCYVLCRVFVGRFYACLDAKGCDILSC